MTDHTHSRLMICPCCGQDREIDNAVCAACGARQVGPALLPPDVLLPKLGFPIAALACVLVILIAFLAFWVFGHDAKVGRALAAYGLSEIPGLQAKLAAELGRSQDFLGALLDRDPKLLLYRIFSYDAYKAAIVI